MRLPWNDFLIPWVFGGNCALCYNKTTEKTEEIGNYNNH